MQLEEMRMAKKMGEDDPQTRRDLEQAQQHFTAMLSESPLNGVCCHPVGRSRKISI